MTPCSRKDAKAQREPKHPLLRAPDKGGRGVGGWGDLFCLAALRLGVKRLAVWIKRRHLRVTEPTPAELIAGWDDISPEEAVSAVHAIAVKTGLCVSFICPLKDLNKTLQRKIICSGRN